jgi:hypothetical protein
MNAIPTGARAALFGLLAGIGVFVLTDVLSKSDIHGPGWSLQGNGALIVLFAAAPALLAAGWVALANRSVGLAVAAGLVTLLLDLLVELAPIVIGPDDALRLGLGFAVVPLVLAALAGVLIARGRGRAPAAVAAVVAISVSLVVPVLEFVLVPLLVPVVLATSSMARHWSGRLAASGAVLLVAMVIGQFASQYLFRSS